MSKPLCPQCKDEANEVRRQLRANGITDKKLIASTAAKAKCKECR